MGKQYSEEEIRQRLDRAARIMGMPCDHVPIQISGRMKRTYGAFVFRIEAGRLVPVAFRFALKLISGDYPETTVDETIYHEYAHFYTNMLHNRNRGHDAYFKAACRKLGIPEHTHFQGNHEEAARRGYRIFCSSCRKEVARRRRVDAARDLSRRYRSGCCQAPLKVMRDVF